MFYHAEQKANSEEMLWRTFSSVGDLKSDIILSYATDSESIISSNELIAGNNIYFSPKLRQCYGYKSELTIPSSNSIDEKLQLWYTTLSRDGVAVLGDISKIVPLSSKRFESVQYNEDSLRLVFRRAFYVDVIKFGMIILTENSFKSDYDKSSYANAERSIGEF